MEPIEHRSDCKSTVYFLRDPVSGEIRYVGITDSPVGRQSDHWQTHPELEFQIVSRHTRKEAYIAERVWISKLTELGCTLLNTQKKKWEKTIGADQTNVF